MWTEIYVTASFNSEIIYQFIKKNSAQEVKIAFYINGLKWKAFNIFLINNSDYFLKLTFL